MLRKIMCELRSAACRSKPYLAKTVYIGRTLSNNCQTSHFTYAEYLTMRKKCSKADMTLLKQIKNIRKSSRSVSGGYNHSLVVDKCELNYVKTSHSVCSGLNYFKSVRNTQSILNPMSSRFMAQHAILPSGIASSVRYYATKRDDFSSIRNRISSLHAKKRAPKKKQRPSEGSEEKGGIVEGFSSKARHKFLTFDPDFDLPEIRAHRPLHRDWQVLAYATADEYDLDGLLEGLSERGLYSAAAINPGNTSGDSAGSVTPPKAPKTSPSHAHHSNLAKHQSLSLSSSSSSHSAATSSGVPDAHDVLHMVATYIVGSENREIYFFREGAVVFWNVPELECSTILQFLTKYEKGRYRKEDIEEESESLMYTYNENASKTRLVRNRIILNPEGATDLEKYTFSNAIAMSVKLGIWEASLDKYIDDIEYVSEELRKTGKVVLSQDQVLQCMGQLFALRHLINLSSDLLDTPDFYWEHENLEQLYQKTCNHLNISKRTSVMNVKLSHCVELMELLKSHLNEKHSARLEWIIIILIMIEVGFEVLHVVERWL